MGLAGKYGGFNFICNVVFLPGNLRYIWHVMNLSGSKENGRRKSVGSVRGLSY